ncbi:stress response domain protein [Burkholderia thailandensis]|nr:stress response domain protein [Burkholderia thailandensis]
MSSRTGIIDRQASGRAPDAVRGVGRASCAAANSRREQ